MILNCEVVKKGFSNENVELLNAYFLTELIENHEEKDEFDYNREVYPLRISKKKNRRQNINLLLISDVIYQTRGRVFYSISKHREVVEKTRCSRVFFNQLQGVWISDETPFRMFDIASQTINNS